MRRKKRVKESISLAQRRKYRFVKPDDDMSVLWNTNVYIARYAALVLKDFIPYSDSVGGTPSEFFHFEDDEDGRKAYSEWHKCMEEMLFAFEQYANDRMYELDEETRERVQHGLDLFAKYFKHLWI